MSPSHLADIFRRRGVLSAQIFWGPRALTVVSARGPGVPESPGVSLPGDSAPVDCADSSQWLVDKNIPTEDRV